MRIPPALPKPAELFLALAVFFFLRASPAPEDVDCSPATCGSGPSVRFPFWITDRHSPYCGLPSFKLSCKDQAPAIRIFSTDYLIRNISYSEQTMDVSVPGRAYNICQPLPRDFNFYSTPFSLLSYPSNLFFYLNCSVDSIPEGYRQIECPSVGKSFVGWSESNALATCESNFSFPSAAPRDIDLGNFSEVASYGFLLRWRAVNCSECLHSGGECRFDVKENRFACRCGDVFRRDSCGEKRKWKKILIGVGAGAGGVVLASLFCLFFYRRQQVERQAVNSKLLSLTASSDRSSRKDLEDGGDTTGAPFFWYEELHEATSGFCPSNELGDGGFGTVYKGKLRDGRVVAVKRLYENNFKRVEQFLNEAAILNRLRHPNLVSLYGCTSRHSRELLLVYEYIPNGTVADHLHGDLAPQRALPWSVRLRIAAETASALAYLHSTAPPIIHRDVKTNNILLDSGFHVKVADFGLSRLFPLDVTHISTAPQGTPGYVDPEYHQCYQLTDKSDVYSFGVVLVELISSKPAVDITRRRNEINLSSMAISMIQSGKLGEFVDQDLGFEADPEVRRTVKVVAELAFRCLQTEKEMRPTMEDALEVLRATMGGKEGETEVVQPVKKIEEVSLLKAIMPPRSPNSVMHNWSSQTTTPNASG